jgi:hypothetical protein
MLLTGQKKFITTQTSKSNHIANEQYSGLVDNPFMRYSAAELKRKFLDVEVRNNPTDCYNCHGMTFASRRTGIYETPEINKIIADDSYGEISKLDTLPGDIVLYYGLNGDIEHSGIVVQKPDNQLNIPIVVSKWGMLFEVIHSVYICPYNVSNVRFYRCKL